MEGLRGRAPDLAMAAGSRGGPLRRRILRLLGVPHEPAPIAARWLAAAAVDGRGDRPGSGLPMVGDRGRRSRRPRRSLALGRDQIPAYELKVAGAVDPANASPSLVAILGDSRLKMMEYVGSMVFTADGRSLIAAANHEIAFWDPRTGEQQRVLRGHTDRVDALAISRDGQTLVSGSYDHLVKVWDVASGKERLTLKGHRESRLRRGHQPRRQARRLGRQRDPALGHLRRPRARPHEAARRAWPVGRCAGIQPRRPDARLRRRRRQDRRLGGEHRPASQDLIRRAAP